MFSIIPSKNIVSFSPAAFSHSYVKVGKMKLESIRDKVFLGEIMGDQKLRRILAKQPLDDGIL